VNAAPDDMPSSAAAAEDHFARAMDELDALHELRTHDPVAAQRRVDSLPPTWRGLAPAETALLRARAQLHTVSTRLTVGEHEAARPLIDELVRQLEEPLLRDPPAPLRAAVQRVCNAGLNARAYLAHGTGDFPGALRAYLQTLDAAREAGDRPDEVRVRVNLANTYEECGLPAQALEEQTLALPMARELGLNELVADIHHNMGNALAAQGQVEQGLASNRAALEAYQRLGHRQKHLFAQVAVAERLLELGRADEAGRALTELAAAPSEYTHRPMQAYAAYLGGRVGLALGDPDRARREFALAMERCGGPVGDRVGQARAQLELAKIDQAQGLLDEAWAKACTALATVQAHEARREVMQAHGLLSQLARQRGDLAAALDHHEAFHQGYVRNLNEDSVRRAQLLAVRHEVDLARGEAERQRLENARLSEALAEIGARLGRGQGAGAATGESRPEDLQHLGLTPREAEVLHWVIRGKTNEETSLILGMGLPGVKKHLRNIYDKLGVDNRTAAADTVRRRARQPAR
jgi:ATP/maltotriose-dependent transcriptional regulator MalT